MKHFYWAAYRVAPCPGCKAHRGNVCITRRGEEYLACHLSRRRQAAAIAGIPARRHGALIKTFATLTTADWEALRQAQDLSTDRGLAALEWAGKRIRGES